MSLECNECKVLFEFGRAKTSDPIHCIECHLTWTGNEAQHCVGCHRTFTNIGVADMHRRPTWDDHIDPATTPGWRELRRNVWTNAKPLSKEALERFQ